MALETLPVYPASLPYKPDMNAFRVLEAYRPPLHTEFEDGPDLMRDSTIGRRAKVAYRIMFRTSALYAAFKDFTETTLRKGSLRFTMPVWLPLDNSYATRTVQIERGSVTAEPWGLGMQVTFNLFIYDW